jgi:plasmid stabilization system protein ParE
MSTGTPEGLGPMPPSDEHAAPPPPEKLTTAQLTAKLREMEEQARARDEQAARMERSLARLLERLDDHPAPRDAGPGREEPRPERRLSPEDIDQIARMASLEDMDALIRRHAEVADAARWEKLGISPLTHVVCERAVTCGYGGVRTVLEVGRAYEIAKFPAHTTEAGVEIKEIDSLLAKKCVRRPGLADLRPR